MEFRTFGPDDPRNAHLRRAGEAVVTVGRVLEFTEGDRVEIQRLATELLEAVEKKQPGMAQIILKLFKVTQRAIARSHAS